MVLTPALKYFYHCDSQIREKPFADRTDCLFATLELFFYMILLVYLGFLVLNPLSTL